LVTSGIRPLDERIGGLEPGGIHLVIGAPGPAKMVATLQFLHEGVSRGEQALLLTDADAASTVAVANAWGFSLEPAWRAGTLQILGFREEFSLRAMRSISPGEVLEELDSLVLGEPARIAVDPGTLFLMGGARTLLGAAFVAWAKKKPATVLATFSVDGDATQLPSAADWLLKAVTAQLVLERRSESLYEIAYARSIPGVNGHEEQISLELKPGAGLVKAEGSPSRRGNDRAGIDERKLLLLSLGDSHATDLASWADRTFDASLVSEPFDAVAHVQGDANPGCVLVHAPRSHVRQAVQACRALRPLTRAAIVFASDDAIRSTDRVNLLEAGADDCLSGGLDFRELGVRIKQAIAHGARALMPRADGASGKAGPVATVGGRVPRATFAAEVERRAGDATLAFFCVLDVTPDGLTAAELEDTLSELVRSADGDLVAASDAGCVVLLQGAREGQLGALLRRIEARVAQGADGSARARVRVLSHPARAPEIRALIGTAGEGP
jgi:hypothetical protein